MKIDSKTFTFINDGMNVFWSTILPKKKTFFVLC